MSLMSKLLMSTVALTSILSAQEQPDNEALVKYVKQSVVKNPDVVVKGVTVIESKTDARLPGWTILMTTMDVEFQKKEIHAPEMMFVKDGLITGHLTDVKTGNDYRELIKPSVPQSYYDETHLLFGNKDAVHKILIFSDPQCPFCQDVVPAIFKAAKDNPTKIAVYYYHLPLLRIHPVSDVLTRVMHIAQHEGKIDIVEKIYTLDIEAKETNLAKILEVIKMQTGYVLTPEQVNAQTVKDALKADQSAAEKLLVTGTPTIYIDGEWDRERDGYEKLLK